MRLQDFPARGVSPSDSSARKNYSSSRRKLDGAHLTVLIREIHRSSRSTYGTLEEHAYFRIKGTRCVGNVWPASYVLKICNAQVGDV